jgi:hypothetical protein
MNWIKCTDMNKQPIYVNIENATSIFWVEQEKASIIGFPRALGTDSCRADQNHAEAFHHHGTSGGWPKAFV